MQVVNGLRYDLVIELALSAICNRTSPECYASRCPFDERTLMLWMTSVVASPGPQPTYTVLSVNQLHSVVSDYFVCFRLGRLLLQLVAMVILNKLCYNGRIRYAIPPV